MNSIRSLIFFLRQGMFMPDCCSCIYPPSSHSTGALCRAGIHKCRIHVERARLWQVFRCANPLSNLRRTLNGTFISHLVGKYRQWSCWLRVTVPLSQLYMAIILFISLELSCSWFIPSPADKTLTEWFESNHSSLIPMQDKAVCLKSDFSLELGRREGVLLRWGSWWAALFACLCRSLWLFNIPLCRGQCWCKVQKENKKSKVEKV